MTESIEDSSSSCDETLIDEEDLNKFTSTLDQFTPAIPETVTKYYMRQCGLQTDDDRVVKLLSVSVQKFMTGIQHKKKVPAATTEATITITDQSTNAASGRKSIASTNQTLTLNDLTHVLEEYEINVKKTFYYT
ncbi:unnamed protein product [Rotaria sordida]|uniref:Transcription initiation factor TFIID subunit 10 n=1 Tax=Rotaria sordida TaxID=392033 RepID=A0A814LPG6_9BILA|nr:unnamed protein product [Rotaria sordida]CAF3584406.1 unnamed protein product [Rotaria sordida]